MSAVLRVQWLLNRLPTRSLIGCCTCRVIRGIIEDFHWLMRIIALVQLVMRLNERFVMRNERIGLVAVDVVDVVTVSIPGIRPAGCFQNGSINGKRIPVRM